MQDALGRETRKGKRYQTDRTGEFLEKIRLNPASGIIKTEKDYLSPFVFWNAIRDNTQSSITDAN